MGIVLPYSGTVVQYWCFDCGLHFVLNNLSPDNSPAAYQDELRLLCQICGTMHVIQHAKESPDFDLLRLAHPGPNEFVPSQDLRDALHARQTASLAQLAAPRTVWQRFIEMTTPIWGWGFWFLTVLFLPLGWLIDPIVQRLPSVRRREHEQTERTAAWRQSQRELDEQSVRLWSGWRTPRPILRDDVPPRYRYARQQGPQLNAVYFTEVMPGLRCGHCQETGKLIWRWDKNECPRCGQATLEREPSDQNELKWSTSAN